MNDNWISVEDRLPKERILKVKWLCKDGISDFGFWHKKYFWQKGEFWTHDARSNEEITHWQPLQEPPKQQP